MKEEYRGESAEQSVLGSILKDGSVVQDVSAIIVESDFLKEFHRQIFAAAISLSMDNQPVDVVTLSSALSSQNINPDLAYLIELARNTPSTRNVLAYARVVRDTSLERQLYQAGQSILALNETDSNVEDKINDAQLMLSQLGENKSAEVYTARDIAPDFVSLLERRLEGQESGLQTGFVELNRRVTGYMPGQLVIIAGRPGMGKTTIAMNIVEHCVLNSGRGLVFSLEMTKEELIERSVASVGKIAGRDLKTGEATHKQGVLQKLAPALKNIIESDLSIVDRGGMTVNQISSIARKLHRSKPLDIILIDYLQLMSGSEASRELEISMISRSLKSLAKELGCPVIAVSQLSRKCEERSNRRPIPSDLRESGAIEQDADIIHFLYRDEVYNPESQHKGIAELITAKFRSGEIGTDYLASNLYCYRFDDYTHPLPVAKPVKAKRFAYDD